MSEQCNNCPSNGNYSADPATCEKANEQTLMGSLNNIRNVIVVMSGKGGVGKSSVTALIASQLARQGKKVGVLDADITGPSQAKAFGIKAGNMQGNEYGMIPPETNLGIKLMSINLLLPSEDEPVIWRGPLLAGAVNQFWGEVDWRELDYMVVDLPPGTGDVPLTVMQSLPVSGIVIVSSPQELAMMVVKKTIKMAQKMEIPIIGLIENMSYAVCPHCNEKLELFGQSQAPKAEEEFNINFLGRLPWDVKFNRLLDQGKIEEYTSETIEQIVTEMIVRLP